MPPCAAFTSTPCWISVRSRRRSGRIAASIGSVRWSRSSAGGSACAFAPASSSASARSTRPPRAAAYSAVSRSSSTASGSTASASASASIAASCVSIGQRRGRRDALQQEVQRRCDAGERRRHRPAHAPRRPGPAMRARGSRRAAARRSPPRPARATRRFDFAQAAPQRRGRAAFAFQRMPHRPGAPQQQQGDAGDDAQADRGGQAAGFAQRRERPGDQRGR